MTDARQSAEEGGAVAPPDPWDPLVRVTHWLIALAVLLNAVLDEGGSALHVWVGWMVLAVLAIRLLWGLIGPAEARFSAFPPAPRAALRHLKTLLRGRPREHRSHNPAGALMVYALWACLALISVTGLVMTDARSPVTLAEEKAAVAAGDWSVLASADDRAENGEIKEIAEEMHEMLANLLLLLVAVHVAGVAVESRALRRNLLRPMLTGSRRG